MRLLPCLAALLLTSCSTIHVSTQHAPEAPRAVGSYRTYAWERPSLAEKQRIYDADTRVSVEKSVDGYLQSRGYQRVAVSAAPDLLIHWDGALKTYSAGGSDMNQGPAATPQPGPTGEAFPSPVGNRSSSLGAKGELELDLVDASTKKPVWRGTARGELTKAGYATTRARLVQEWLDQAVAKLFADFPSEVGKN